MASVSTQSSESLFEQISLYAWSEDAEFQAGLKDIAGSESNTEIMKTLETQAQCFYYSRKFNVPVDIEEFQKWKTQRDGEGMNGIVGSEEGKAEKAPEPARSSAVGGGSGAEPPYPSSFAEIVDLITSGKPVPGIKEIPTTVLEGNRSESLVESRRKPWERAE